MRKKVKKLQNRQPQSPSSCWKTVVTVAILSITLLMIGGYFFFQSSSDSLLTKKDEVAMINNVPVAAEEMKLIGKSLRTDVMTYFHEKYGVPVEEDFWTSSFGDETPAEKLVEMTLERLRRIKTEQALCQQYGLLKDASYPAFLKDLEAENQRRQSLLDQGEPVYGVEQFTAEQYYEYLHSNRVLRLREKLNAEVFDLSDEVLRRNYPAMVQQYALYQENGLTPKSFDEVKDTIYFRTAEQEYEAYIAKKAAMASLIKDDEKLESLILY